MKSISDFGDAPETGFPPSGTFIEPNKWQAKEPFKPLFNATEHNKGLGQPESKKTATGQTETIDERIQRAQSWNLAVALVAPSIPTSCGVGNREEIKILVEHWQKYFHDKLKNK